MRIALLGDVGLHRQRIGDALALHPEVTVLADGRPTAAGVARVRRLRPDVALVDVAPAGVTGALRDLVTGLSGVRTVAVGVPGTEYEVLACLEAGVAAYVHRDHDLARLVETLRQVVRGGVICSPAITGGLFRRLAALADVRRAAGVELTAREREIAGLLADGLSNREIGRRLYIEVSTVKNHVHHILEKLELASRAEAAAWFCRQGVVV